MPIKRRVEKGRKQLDCEELEDHFYGPGTVLLNGCGYCGQVVGKDRWEDLSAIEREEVSRVMAVDWQRHSAMIIAAWRARDDHALYCARQFHADPPEPWSLSQFGRLG